MLRLLAAMIAFVGLAAAATAQEYRIRSGDTLLIEVLEDPGLNRSVLVVPDGTFTFPFAGTTRARGRTVAEVQSALRSALTPNFAAPPNVVVSVAALVELTEEQRRGPLMPVYVLGEVNNPGLIEVRRGTTLLQFLAASGGFTRFAATNRVQLRRTDPRTGRETAYPFDYRAATKGALGAGTIVLQAGDVIIVPERRLFE
jgi:polysaccharide export outer membrane protein